MASDDLHAEIEEYLEEQQQAVPGDD